MNESEIAAALKRASYQQLSPYLRRMKLAVEEKWRVRVAGTYDLAVPFYGSRRAFDRAIAMAFSRLLVFRSDQMKFALDMLKFSDSLDEIHSDLVKAGTSEMSTIEIGVRVYRRAAARPQDRWVYRVVFFPKIQEFSFPEMGFTVQDRWTNALNVVNNHFPDGKDKKLLQCLLRKGIALGPKQTDMWFSHTVELYEIFKEGGNSERMKSSLESFFLNRRSIPTKRMMFIRVHERLSKFTGNGSSSSQISDLRDLLKDINLSITTIRQYLDTQQSAKHLGIFERHYYAVVIEAVMKSPKQNQSYQARTAAYGCFGPHGPLPVRLNVWEKLEKGV